MRNIFLLLLLAPLGAFSQSTPFYLADGLVDCRTREWGTSLRNFDIKKWSNNSTTTVYVVDANYSITRNYRREVLNKYVPAIIR
jgi:hypothetical protein